MKTIRYTTEEDNIFYDFDTIRKILNTSKSKLHREFKKNNITGTKYKNQFLYDESILYGMMEKVLLEKLDSYGL
jgi:hypothetical protein